MKTRIIVPLARYLKQNTKPFLVEDYGWYVSPFKGMIDCIFNGNLFSTLYSWNQSFGKKFEVEILDARQLKAASGLSNAEFFHKYGFTLLDHKTKCTHNEFKQSDFVQSVSSCEEMCKEKKRYYEKETPVKNVYGQEMRDLVLEQIEPRATEFVIPAIGQTRCPGTQAGDVSFIHSDFPCDQEQFEKYNQYIMEDNISKKLKQVRTGEMAEYQYINWWRATDAMQGPIQMYPLCVLDTTSVDRDDIVVQDMLNAGIPAECDTIRFLGIKYNPSHRWYFYPEMNKDEVLVFKQFEMRTGDSNGRIPCFHTAFVDPLAPKNAEKRHSFEYRMSYMVPT